MINFSKISNRGFAGKILRKVLNIFPKPEIIRIFQGPLRGKKWIVNSGVSGYWLGTYEREHQQILEKVLKEGDVFFDIGAHVGIFTILASQLVGKSGRIFAFEPLKRNVSFLNKHIALNGCNNVVVIEAAVSDSEGDASFDEGENSFMGKLSSKGAYPIKMVTIDRLVDDKLILPPSVIKIDVEGFQEGVLTGAMITLQKYHPKIILEASYKKGDPENFYSILTSLGYIIEPIGEESLESAGDFFAYKK
ncbi:MAG: FkbM family methyltransferase [Patescibacteria group bacterium]